MRAVERPNVLISSAGRRVSLLRAFQTAAARNAGKVFACDMTVLSPAMQLADGAFEVPRCTDAEFVPRVLEICAGHQIGCIVPTIDTELPVYAEHRAALNREGVEVLVSSPQCVAIGMDKIATHDWLTQEGFPTVRQAALGERTTWEWQFPAIVKPRRGSASIGVQRVVSPEQLRWLDGSDLIVQEQATGVEFTIDVLVSARGQCVAAVPRERLEVRAGEVSKGVTRRVPELEELARSIAERLPDAYGTLNIQVFYERRSREARVIEINPRFGGGYPLTHEAGADFASFILDELTGNRSHATISWESDVTMLRYDEAVFLRGDARR